MPSEFHMRILAKQKMRETDPHKKEQLSLIITSLRQQEKEFSLRYEKIKLEAENFRKKEKVNV